MAASCDDGCFQGGKRPACNLIEEPELDNIMRISTSRQQQPLIRNRSTGHDIVDYDGIFNKLARRRSAAAFDSGQDCQHSVMRTAAAAGSCPSFDFRQEGAMKEVELNMVTRPTLMSLAQLKQERQAEHLQTLQLLPTKPKELELDNKLATDADSLLTLSLYTASRSASCSFQHEQYNGEVHQQHPAESALWRPFTTTSNSSTEPNLDLKI